MLLGLLGDEYHSLASLDEASSARRPRLGAAVWRSVKDDLAGTVTDLLSGGQRAGGNVPGSASDGCHHSLVWGVQL